MLEHTNLIKSIKYQKFFHKTPKYSSVHFSYYFEQLKLRYPYDFIVDSCNICMQSGGLQTESFIFPSCVVNRSKVNKQWIPSEKTLCFFICPSLEHDKLNFTQISKEFDLHFSFELYRTNVLWPCFNF